MRGRSASTGTGQAGGVLLVAALSLSLANPAVGQGGDPSMVPATLAGAEPRADALRCMTEAIYYEAANEPDEGQRAVAEVILNRRADPAYPKSVCGVVFQGSERRTGCQFTFTCDGSRRRSPVPGLWARAEAVAAEAIAGSTTTPQVAGATHYHAFYVHPGWRLGLVMTRRIGAHLFYRTAGPVPRTAFVNTITAPPPAAAGAVFAPWGLRLAPTS